jgi:hypothetical protein
VTALTSRQRELLAAVHAREIAWDAWGAWDLELVDEARGAALLETDVSWLYDLEVAGLVDLGEPHPRLTLGGQWLLAERREPVPEPWGRGWLLAVAMSLASVALSVLLVWLIFGVWWS